MGKVDIPPVFEIGFDLMPALLLIADFLADGTYGDETLQFGDVTDVFYHQKHQRTVPETKRCGADHGIDLNGFVALQQLQARAKPNTAIALKCLPDGVADRTTVTGRPLAASFWHIRGMQAVQHFTCSPFDYDLS